MILPRVSGGIAARAEAGGSGGGVAAAPMILARRGRAEPTRGGIPGGASSFRIVLPHVGQ
jgi:hypothetical protein